MFDNFDFNTSDLNYNIDSFNKKNINIKNINELSLEEILNEDELIQELESQNQEFINYFYNKTKIQQMLDYIIKEPSPESDINRGYKFPFLCSQIFNIENIKILDFLLKTNTELIPLIQQQKKNIRFFDDANSSKTEENVIINNNDSNEYDDEVFNNKNKDSSLNFKNFDMDEDQVNFGELNSSKKNTLDNEEDIVKIENDDSSNSSTKNSNKLIKKAFSDNNKKYNLIQKNLKNNCENDNQVNNINEEDDIDNVNFASIEHFNENDSPKNCKISNDNDQVINNKKDDSIKKIDNFIDQKDETKNKRKQKLLFEKIKTKTEKKMKKNKFILKLIENNNQNEEGNSSLRRKLFQSKKICNIKSNLPNTNKSMPKNENKINNIKTKNIKECNNLKKNLINRIELLDYLLDFLKDDIELNYVLCGYFSSILNNLMNVNPKIFFSYIYTQRKDILKRFVYHSYRNSIAQNLSKILLFDVNNLKKNSEIKIDEKEIESIKMETIKDIFKKINISMDPEKLSSFSFLISDLIDNKDILENVINNKRLVNILITKQLLNLNLDYYITSTGSNIIKKHNSSSNSVIKINLVSNTKNEEKLIFQRKNFIIIVDILIKIVNNIKKFSLKLPIYEQNLNSSQNSNDKEKQNNNDKIKIQHTLFSKALYDELPSLIRVNFNYHSNTKCNNSIIKKKEYKEIIIQSFNDTKLKPLGIYRTKIVELIHILFFYFEKISNDFDQLLIYNRFFENAFYYLYEYDLNNIYQENLLLLLKKFLDNSSKHPILAEHLFNKLRLLDSIMNHIPKKIKPDLNIKLSKTSNIQLGLNNKINLGCSKNGYVAFLISLSYKINTIIGGQFLNLKNSYSKEGSITYINRFTQETKGEETENDINKFNNEYKSKYRYDDLIPKEEKNRSKIKFIGPIDCMKKYCNEKWRQFFKENISERIKLYENKLCLKGEIENDYKKCNMDIDGNILENIFNSNKNEMEFKDMEINLNEFNFPGSQNKEKDIPSKNINKNNNKQKNNESKKEENNLVKSIQLNHQRMMVDEIDFAENNLKDSGNLRNELKNSAIIDNKHRYFNIK